MDPSLRRRVIWEEHREARVWTFRFRDCFTPEGSITAAVLAGLLSIFLVYFGPGAHGGGGVPAFAVLLMAVPIGLFGVVAVYSDLEQLRFRIFRVDPDRITYGQERAAPETTVVTADVHDLVVRRWGGFELVDREGGSLFSSYQHVGEPGLARIRGALAEARAPRTYRG